MKYEAIEIGDDIWLLFQIGDPILAPGFEVGKLYDEIEIDIIDQYRHMHCDWTDGRPVYEIENVSYLYRKIARTILHKPTPYPGNKTLVSAISIRGLIEKYENTPGDHVYKLVDDLKQLLK